MPSSYQVALWKQESFLVLDSCLLLHDDSCMNEYDVEEELTGAEGVRQWFASWPNFHDAEVISLSLARKGQSVLRVYPYYPHKPATVDFIFENVTDIELQDFRGPKRHHVLENRNGYRPEWRQGVPIGSRPMLRTGRENRCKVTSG